MPTTSAFSDNLSQVQSRGFPHADGSTSLKASGRSAAVHDTNASVPHAARGPTLSARRRRGSIGCWAGDHRWREPHALTAIKACQTTRTTLYGLRRPERLHRLWTSAATVQASCRALQALAGSAVAD